MNDFFLASNKTITNKIGVTVSQITVKDLDVWLQHAEQVRKALNKNYSDENLETVIELHKLPVLFLCALVIDKSTEDLVSLISNNADGFIELFKNIVSVNQAYFDQDENTKSKKNNKTEPSWFDSFQFLVSKGHSHSDILNYSFGTFIEYLKAAQRNEKTKILSIANAVRMAHHANQNEFNKFADELNKN